jgi:hypothetical protein
MKRAPGRTTPRIPGGPVYGHGELRATPGNIVYKHNQKYHVFVGLNRVMVTDDMQAAFVEAARKPAA